ncbi:MAG TPA: VWA domain-containing protein [Acidobacteriaceae bacterium]
MTPDSSFRKLFAAAGFAALVTLPSLPLCAQTTAPAAKPQETQPSGPVVNSNVGAVSMPVTVVDDKGNPVKSLTAADLKLTDNGAEQKIQSFGPAAPTPAVFGLIGQTSSGQRLELGDERLGAVHFVDHILPGTQDQAFVIQYASEVDLLGDPTSNASKLHDAINQLGSPQFGQSSGDNGNTSDQSAENSHQGGSGGTLYDAIYLAATEELKKMPGQHVIVLVTDGVDHGSKESMSDAVEAAQSANAAIFAIYYKSEAERPANSGQNTGHKGGGFPGGGGGYPGGGGGYPGGSHGGQTPSPQPQEDGRPTLEHICSATGGYMIEGKHDKSDEAFTKLVALLHNQYTLTFVPTTDASASAYQRLSLTTLKKGVYPLVQEGYTPQQ